MSASGGKQTFLGSGVEGVAGVVGEDCPSRTWFVRDSYLHLSPGSERLWNRALQGIWAIRDQQVARGRLRKD